MGDWKEKALETQQELYERLGDRKWDRIQPEERWALESKVEFAMFGEPTDEFTDPRYITLEQYKEITKMCDLIYEVRGSTDVLVAFLFLIGKGSGDMFMVPVFRVMKESGDAAFIDVLGRVYESWSDFMENNKMPECEFSYPRSGVYEADDYGNVLASFAQSPCSSLGSRLPNNMYVTYSVPPVSPATICIGSLILPVAGPIISGATLSSAAERGSRELGDRSSHQKTESSWLSTLGSALSDGFGLAMKAIVAVTSIDGSLTTSKLYGSDATNEGLKTGDKYGIDNDLVNKKEINDEEERRTLEVMRFMNSVLFFTNSAMNTETAGAIVRQVQGETLNNFRADQMDRKERALDRLTRTSKVEGRMINNAEIIKGITYFRSKEELFGMTAWVETASTSTYGKNWYVDKDVGLETTQESDC